MRLRLNRPRSNLARCRLVWCGVASLAACASTTSQAQSSVSLYGVVDTGVAYVTNVGPQRSNFVHMTPLTGSLPSRWGFQGKEDLGGGLRAVFNLESGFSPTQGTLNQGGRLFGRQAYVGISGPWGTLTFGRQYSQAYWALKANTMGPNVFGALDLDTYFAASQKDNAVAYTFTSSGLTAGATYSFGRDTVASAAAGGCAQSVTDWRACKAMSARLQYETEKWSVAAAVDRNYGGGGTGSPLPSSSQTDTRILIDGYAMFGNSTIGTGFVHRINHGAQTATVFNAISNFWWFGGTYLLRPDIALDAQFGHLTVSGSDSGASVIAARAMYFLSKQTATYVTVGRMFNQRHGTFALDASVIPPAATPLPGVNQTGVMVGIRHLF
jgi:predicted porin